MRTATIPAPPGTPTVDLVLVARGNRPVAVLKVLQEITGLALKACIALRNDLPSTLTVPNDRAQAIATRLQEAGATLQTGAAILEADGFDDLERLGRLHDRGILDDDEFAVAKAVILDRN